METFEVEKQEQELKRKIRQAYPNYRQEIDDFLGREAYGGLLEYYQSQKMRELSCIENDAAILAVILSIYHMEQQEGMEHGILSGIHDLKSAQQHYLKVKFLMWRLAFFDESSELSAYVAEHHVSVHFLKYLVHTSAFEKANTAYKLAMMLKVMGSLEEAFVMLCYVDELSPNEEIVFCEMADIFIQLEQYENARTCIKKIQVPSEKLLEYQNKWGISDE